MMTALRLALLLLLTPSECLSVGPALTRTAAPSRLSPAGIVAAARKPPPKKKGASGVDFSKTGSTDTDGYTRGSFGIGENESSSCSPLEPASLRQSARRAGHSPLLNAAHPLCTSTFADPNPHANPDPNSDPISLTLAEVIWALLAAALISGGALDDETAQKIGEAQRGFYPSPPGIEQVEAIKSKRAAS